MCLASFLILCLTHPGLAQLDMPSLEKSNINVGWITNSLNYVHGLEKNKTEEVITDLWGRMETFSPQGRLTAMLLIATASERVRTPAEALEAYKLILDDPSAKEYYQATAN